MFSQQSRIKADFQKTQSKYCINMYVAQDMVIVDEMQKNVIFFRDA